VKRKWIRSAIAATTLFLGAGFAATPSARGAEDSALAAALDSIRAEDCRAHVAFLADDAREGRLPGTRGSREAAEYVADRFAVLGLAPAGEGESYFQSFDGGWRNVLGLLGGADPELAQETIVVGAHYDHVGRGTWRNSRDPRGEVHNGADDNASGTSGLVELAEAFAALPTPPRRSVLFAAWDAEELGMLGSKHWVAHRTIPGRRVVFLLNMDMIGRLRENRLEVFGVRSGRGLRRLVAECNRPGFDCQFVWSTDPKADHWPFFDAGTPFVALHTGLHDEYHTPDDDAHLIDHEGMRRVLRLAFRLVHTVAQSDRPPAFRPVARHETDGQRDRLAMEPPAWASRLGVQWDESDRRGGGALVTHVFSESPASRAALQPGDRIVRLGKQEIRSGDELRRAVMTAGREVALLVHRPGLEEPKRVAAELDGRPLRLGITWRVDSAEPGTVVLTGVLTGSPAAEAGLVPGDRIYQVAGRDFADDAQFARLVAELPSPLELLVERDGRLEVVTVELGRPPIRKAA